VVSSVVASVGESDRKFQSKILVERIDPSQPLILKTGIQSCVDHEYKCRGYIRPFEFNQEWADCYILDWIAQIAVDAGRYKRSRWAGAFNLKLGDLSTRWLG